MVKQASAFQRLRANSTPPEPMTRQSETIPAPLFSVRVRRQRQWGRHLALGPLGLGYPLELLLALSTAATPSWLVAPPQFGLGGFPLACS